MYGLCLTAKLPKIVKRIVEYISRASFCIFLTHIFFLKALSSHGINALMGSAVYTVPLISGLILVCSCGVYEILRRIPGIRRYLI